VKEDTVVRIFAGVVFGVTILTVVSIAVSIIALVVIAIKTGG